MDPSENEEEIARLKFKGALNQEPSPEDLEAYYSENILPIYGITQEPTWEHHIQTDPDSFLHLFTIGETRYALAFDDYPSGFSVGGEAAVTTVKTKDGAEILAVSSPYDKYIENAFGYFKLFKVTDDAEFVSLVAYLENDYKKLLDKWHQESRHIVSISRDILQLAETASANHDGTALYSLGNFVGTLIFLDAVDNNIDLTKLAEYIKILNDAEFGYETYSEEQKERLAEEIYRTLAHDAIATIMHKEYAAKNLGQPLTLASAIYVKQDGDATSGITVNLFFDKSGVVYPRDHFINEEVKQYMLLHPYISEMDIADNMPETLRDYRLVAGSVTTQKIFRRELEYINL